VEGERPLKIHDAALVVHIVENAMLNGEVIRLGGAVRMPPELIIG
jgi:hypothetical protein